MDLALTTRGEDAASPLAVARVNLAYWWRHGRKPNVDHPRLFTEWVQWRKLYDRDPALARLTDKSDAKALAARLLGEQATIPTLWRGAVLPVKPPAPLPFVVKANHGCNQYRIVRTQAEWDAARALSPEWMATTYGYWLDEWHYCAADKALLVEPFVSDDGDLPRDYKVYVFGGRAQAVQVHLDREHGHHWMQFDRDWRLLSNPKGTVPAPPINLAAMLAGAEAIADVGRDFLRVDFYEVGGRMLFGETCLFPGSGLDPFDPPALDGVLGDMWSAAAGMGFAGLEPAVPDGALSAMAG